MSLSPTARPTNRHVSDIIHLHPSKEPWCAGYAISQGRRCCRPIIASDCAAACSLLDEAIDKLHAGCSIDQFFQNLAPLVLCKSSHQNQASHLMATWGRQIRNFHIIQTAWQDPLVFEHEYRTGLAQMIARSDEVVTDIHNCLDPSHVGSLWTRVMAATSATSQLRTERYSSTSTDTNLQRFELPTMRSEARSSAHPARAGTTGSSSSSVLRRCVEGNCVICQLLLWEPGHSTDEEEINCNRDEKDNKEGQIEHTLIHSRTLQECDKLLVWCKKRCGTNFHKSCMDRWVEACQKDSHPVQCPICRSPWKA
ncbi:hypothetical protein BDV27DRAFT_151859 [Aspergillus caelatus]|uniref:RING-type domain-containing protein n=1 Tax=Aspergillus caelatus TaxID=61420 RepID=A0A5N7ANM7_9EURO|nr:uncharacterized protein BDV27DRAFT_151859 [Aspergillus caelatus]KAE8370599.1 hypothetical protein BDV27DRAFT_151859 [Aspergillus caelatus]